ncbi:hypothetical protein D3C76_314120 [compost metagenome]
MNRAWIQRYRLPLAWSVIALLLTFLLLREGLVQWRQLSQWQPLAQMAAGLQRGPALNLEHLRQTAQSHRIELADVQAQGKDWQLRGQVTDAQALQGWLQALRADGVQPLQWGLEQTPQGLSFALVVRP